MSVFRGHLARSEITAVGWFLRRDVGWVVGVADAARLRTSAPSCSLYGSTYSLAERRISAPLEDGQDWPL
jgi:hypothetical protein